MKEYDRIVSITKIESIEVGTHGIVVYIYEWHNACEVEFFDENNQTIDVVTCRFDQLEILK